MQQAGKPAISDAEAEVALHVLLDPPTPVSGAQFCPDLLVFFRYHEPKRFLTFPRLVDFSRDLLLPTNCSPAWQSSSSLLQHSIIERRDADDGRPRDDALPPAVQRGVDPGHRQLADEAAERDALVVDHERQQRLDDAEGQGIDLVLRLSSSRPAPSGLLVVCGAEIEEIPREGGEDAGSGEVEQDGAPEGAGEEEEHVRQVDGVVVGVEPGDGGDGEGVAVGEDLLTKEVGLKELHDEEDGAHGREARAHARRGLLDAGLLVERGGALPDGDGGTVHGGDHVGGGGGEGDALGEGESAARGLHQGVGHLGDHGGERGVGVRGGAVGSFAVSPLWFSGFRGAERSPSRHVAGQ